MLVYDPRAIGLDVASMSGQEAMCLCPFHNDHKPSASFNVKTGLFICYTCHTGSNAYQLSKKLGGEVKFVPSQRLQITVREAEDMEWKHILNFPKAIGNKYLKSRQVSDKQVEEFGILASPSGIIIPLKSMDGEVEGAIMRRYDGNPRYMFFGEKTPAWPLNKLASHKKLTNAYMTEGVFGALRARSFGIPAYATLGAMVNQALKPIFQSHYPVILFDNDYAGMLGAARLMVIVPTAKVIIPGQEADELDEDEWKTLAKEGQTTRSLSVLAKLSKNSKEFHKSITKFMKKQRGDYDPENRKRREEEETWDWP